MSFAKLQMLKDVGLSEVAYGFGAGIFFLGYFVFEVPSNLILYRVGARKWIARIMISWSLLSAAMMFVKTATSYYLLRFALGIAEAGFFPGVILYLTSWYPAERRGGVITIFMTSVAISSAVGSLLSGWVMQTLDGVRGLAGWQWLFLVESAPAAIVGAIVLVVLRDSPAQAGWLDENEKLLLSQDLSRDESTRQQSTFWRALFDVRVWVLCLIYFCAALGLYGIAFWLPTIIAGMGVKSTVSIGYLTAIPYTVAAIGMAVVGRRADMLRERYWRVGIPMAAGAVGLTLSVVVQGNSLFAVSALSLATLGILTAIPLFWSLPTSYLRGIAAAMGIAIVNSFGNLAGFVGPYFVGWLKELTGSTGAGMCFLAGAVFIGSLLVVTVARNGGKSVDRPSGF